MFGRAVLCCDTVLYCTYSSAPEGHRKYYVLLECISHLCIRVVLEGIC